MALKPEAVERFLAEHTLENRQGSADKNIDDIRKASNRRHELVDQLLENAWGRELWYDIIAEAGVLNRNAMTGNSQSYYILGLQAVAKKNMDWAKAFHFDKWMMMEQEAHNRRKEVQDGTS